jgi:hypothetical protein
MSLPIVLAHGALGNFDELIFLGVAVIFFVMMGVSWVKSRNTQPKFEELPPQESSQPAESPDHFKLE